MGCGFLFCKCIKRIWNSDRSQASQCSTINVIKGRGRAAGHLPSRVIWSHLWDYLFYSLLGSSGHSKWETVKLSHQVMTGQSTWSLSCHFLPSHRGSLHPLAFCACQTVDREGCGAGPSVLRSHPASLSLPGSPLGNVVGGEPVWRAIPSPDHRV